MLYRRIEMPPEPWTHEDNPDWLLIHDFKDGDYFLVPVEPDYEAAAMEIPDEIRIEMTGTEEAAMVKRIVVAALKGDT